MPDWRASKEGFQSLLESLFKVTPPTAVIAEQLLPYITPRYFLAKRRLGVPEDVSILYTNNEPCFAWSEPSVAHILSDTGLMVRRLVRWAANISMGKSDIRQTLSEAEFIDGGTLGPVRPSKPH